MDLQALLRGEIDPSVLANMPEPTDEQMAEMRTAVLSKADEAYGTMVPQIVKAVTAAHAAFKAGDYSAAFALFEEAGNLIAKCYLTCGILAKIETAEKAAKYAGTYEMPEGTPSTPGDAKELLASMTKSVPTAAVNPRASNLGGYL